MSDDWYRRLEPTMRQVSRELTRQYSDVDYNDCFQVAALWAVANPRRRDEYLGRNEIAPIAKAMRDEIRKFCQKERAATGLPLRPGDHLQVVEPGDMDELIDLRLAKAALPDRERRALEYHYGEGLTEREIAERLGVAPATAHDILSRGRRMVLGRLDDTEGGVA